MKRFLFYCCLLVLFAASCSNDVVLENHYALAQFQVPGTANVYYVCDSAGVAVAETFEAEHLHRVGSDGKCLDCYQDFYVDDFELTEIITFAVDEVPCAGLYREKIGDVKVVKTILYQDIEIPIVILDGKICDATKENTVNVSFSIDTGAKKKIASKGTVKVQGSSSARYPKKNFTLKLDDKVKIVESWGKQKKYCLKANYVDFSQLRNVVSAKIFGKIVKSRGIKDELDGLVNGGAIDGFPVIIFNNGAFHGLYTFNIPKDKWLFGMKDSDSKDKAILMADDNEPVDFLEEFVSPSYDNGMVLEFASNEESSVDNDTTWVADSFNKLIDFVQKNDGQDFKDGISEFTDVSRCIDAMIYTYAIGGKDNIGKNILWVTFDGKKWYPSMYDMDGVWGLKWDGSLTISFLSLLLNKSPRMCLWNKIYNNYYSEIRDRYNELRAGILSQEEIEREFNDFSGKIPSIVYAAEKKKWTEVPSQNTNNLKQIFLWASNHLALMDIVFK